LEFDFEMAEVVGTGVSVELGVEVTRAVDMTVMRAIDGVIFVAVLTGDVNGVLDVGEGSLSLAAEVMKKSEKKSSVLVFGSSVSVE
jgi:hypothetical protein